MGLLKIWWKQYLGIIWEVNKRIPLTIKQFLANLTCLFILEIWFAVDACQHCISKPQLNSCSTFPSAIFVVEVSNSSDIIEGNDLRTFNPAVWVMMNHTCYKYNDWEVTTLLLWVMDVRIELLFSIFPTLKAVAQSDFAWRLLNLFICVDLHINIAVDIAYYLRGISYTRILTVLPSLDYFIHHRADGTVVTFLLRLACDGIWDRTLDFLAIEQNDVGLYVTGLVI